MSFIYSAGAGEYVPKNTQWDTVCASKKPQTSTYSLAVGPTSREWGTALGCPWSMHGASLKAVCYRQSHAKWPRTWTGVLTCLPWLLSLLMSMQHEIAVLSVCFISHTSCFVQHHVSWPWPFLNMGGQNFWRPSCKSLKIISWFPINDSLSHYDYNYRFHRHIFVGPVTLQPASIPL